MSNPNWLTNYEIMILEKIGEQKTVKKAAENLNLHPYTIYSILYRVRKKAMKSQNTINLLNNLKRKHPILRRLTTPIIKERMEI